MTDLGNPEATAATAYREENDRLREINEELLTALNKIANGNGVYGAQADEYKQIARAAIAKAEGTDQ